MLSVWKRRWSRKSAPLRSLQCWISHVRTIRKLDWKLSSLVEMYLSIAEGLRPSWLKIMALLLPCAIFFVTFVLRYMAIRCLRTIQWISNVFIYISLVTLATNPFSHSHRYCLDPPLRAVPTGDWFCRKFCFMLLSVEGIEIISIDPSVKEFWMHYYFALIFASPRFTQKSYGSGPRLWFICNFA